MRAIAKAPWIWAVAAALAAAGLWGVNPARVGAESKPADDDRSPAEARLIVVKMEAEWCGKCRQMKKALDQTRQTLAEEPVLFVVLDHTDKARVMQSQYLASAMGLHETWRQHGGKTGFAVLVNPADKQIVGRLAHDMTTEQMVAAVRQALPAPAQVSAQGGKPDAEIKDCAACASCAVAAKPQEN